MQDYNKNLRDKIQDMFPLTGGKVPEKVNEEKEPIDENVIEAHPVEFPSELPEPIVDEQKDEIRERISNLVSDKRLSDMLDHFM